MNKRKEKIIRAEVVSLHPAMRAFTDSLERLNMTLSQAANGKNETFADCFQLSVR